MSSELCELGAFNLFTFPDVGGRTWDYAIALAALRVPAGAVTLAP
jgi:hypothetical protein